jgi:hypothetical protein
MCYGCATNPPGSCNCDPMPDGCNCKNGGHCNACGHDSTGFAESTEPSDPGSDSGVEDNQ